MTAQHRSVDIGIQSTRDIVKEELRDFVRESLYIALPAKVLGVQDYESMQCVDVRGVINDTYEDDATVPAVLIKKVFVKLPSGGNFSIKLPIKVGDLVTLHWSHRSLNTFLGNSGDAVDTPIDRVSDVRDCWVQHGFGTRSNNQSPSLTDFIISGPNTEFTIKPDGITSLITASDVLIETEAEITGKCSKATLDTPLVETTGDLKVGGNLEVVGSSLKVGGAEVYGHDHTGMVPPFI